MVYTEIDRATDNLVKSGKWMGGAQGGPRRESMPQMVGRPYPEYGEFIFLSRNVDKHVNKNSSHNSQQHQLPQAHPAGLHLDTTR